MTKIKCNNYLCVKNNYGVCKAEEIKLVFRHGKKSGRCSGTNHRIWLTK